MTTHPTPGAAAKPVRRRRKEDRPGELLAAALRLFVQRGYAATRVEDVARLAGVSKGTLFLYFESKEALLKAVIRDSISNRYEEWAKQITAFSGSSADLLRHCVSSWWEHIGRTPAGAVSRLMLTERPHLEHLVAFYRQEVVEPGNALIAQVLQRGVARGEFRPMDIPCGVALVTAPMLWLALHHHCSVRDASSAPDWDPVRYLDTQLTLLLNGLQVPPTSRTP
ncbi:MAG: hypothetical protein OHK0048_14770 [Rhodoferax sp.]